MTCTRRRLADHITEALDASVARVLAAHPERRDELAEWRATAHERVVVRADVGQDRRGRIRHDSLRLAVHLITSEGLAPLCTVRVRDLVDEHGQPLDAKELARELLWQNGIGIPDDASELTGEADGPVFS